MEIRYIPERALFLTRIEDTNLELYLTQSGSIKIIPQSDFYEAEEDQSNKNILEFLLLAIGDR